MALSEEALAAALACDDDAPPPSQEAVDRVTAALASIRRDRARDAENVA